MGSSKTAAAAIFCATCGGHRSPGASRSRCGKHGAGHDRRPWTQSRATFASVDARGVQVADLLHVRCWPLRAHAWHQCDHAEARKVVRNILDVFAPRPLQGNGMFELAMSANPVLAKTHTQANCQAVSCGQQWSQSLQRVQEVHWTQIDV